MLRFSKKFEIMLLLFTLNLVKTPQQLHSKQLSTTHYPYLYQQTLELLIIHCLTRLKITPEYKH